MQVGDLVKHPRGMINVCKDLYGCGLILRVDRVGKNGEHIQCLVAWLADASCFLYQIQHLEVISEKV